MSSLIDISSLSLNPKEADQVNQAIFERVITGGKLESYHDIWEGITMKEQIVFIGALSEVGKVIANCSFTDGGQQVPFSQKYWDPVMVGGRLIHCAKDVNALLKLFKKAAKVNPDYFDRIGSEELGVVALRLEQAIESMLNRLVWFGDKAAADVSGGGVYADGTDVDYYNAFDGLFKQVFAEVIGSNKVAISENAGASYAAQSLPADAALAYFRSCYKAQKPVMHQARSAGATVKFLVTREIAENYQDTMEDKSLAFMLTRAEQGSDSMQYRGIEIEIRDDWDMVIALQDNGTVKNIPHRVLLTAKENIPVGTLSSTDFDTIESFYDQKDKNNYMDFAMTIDAKLLEADLAVAAY